MTPPRNASTETDPATGLRAGTFAVGTFSAAARSFPGLVHPDGAVADLSDRFTDLHDVFDDWERNFAVLGDVAAAGAATLHVDDLRPLPPLRHPNLLMSGANYKTHVAQMLTKNEFNQHNRLSGESDEDFFARNLAMMEQRAADGTPFFWTGLHSCLVGAHDDVVLPPLGDKPDWELELGVVIGRGGRLVTPDEAEQMIAGYTIVNDLGTVDLFRRTDIPWGYDWISKHQPTFKPAGPFIVPAPFVEIDDTVRIRLSVNGETMQDWPVDDFVFGPAQVITYASERVNLTPGDIVCMGSPPGNGAHHGRFLRDGDVMDGEITYLGRQRNRCVVEDLEDRKPHFGLWKWVAVAATIHLTLAIVLWEIHEGFAPPSGGGVQIPLMLIAGLLVVLVGGPGPFSLDNLLKWDNGWSPDRGPGLRERVGGAT